MSNCHMRRDEALTAAAGDVEAQARVALEAATAEKAALEAGVAAREREKAAIAEQLEVLE